MDGPTGIKIPVKKPSWLGRSGRRTTVSTALHSAPLSRGGHHLREPARDWRSSATKPKCRTDR